MPKRGRKKRRLSSPRRGNSRRRKRYTEEDSDDSDVVDVEYTCVEVEELSDDGDGEIGEKEEEVKEEEDGEEEEEEEEEDDEAHRIDISWIKEEPVDDELYTHPQEEHNGDVNAVKRRWQAEEDDINPNSKFIKTESGDEDDDVDVVNDKLKTEEEDDDTDDYWEEEEGDILREEDRVPALVLQKCAKCAIMFSPGSANLPSALRNLCKKCKPNVSMTCQICGKHFEHHKLFKRHVRDCSNNHFECMVCKDRFPTNRKLLGHRCIEENLTRMLRYICPICCEGFEKAKHRNLHKSQHVTLKSVKCRNCRLIFKDLATCQEHNDTHEFASRTFICLICHVSFDTQAAYFADQRKHKIEKGEDIEIRRPPEFVYVCGKCRRWYDDLHTFRAHSCNPKKAHVKVDFDQSSVILRSLDFGVSDMDIHDQRRKSPRIQKEPPPKPISYPVKQPHTLPRPAALPKPAASEVSQTPAPLDDSMVLDSTFKCHLCHLTFASSRGLGHHSCLSQDFLFDDEDDDEESDESGNNWHSQGDNNLPFIRLTSGQPLNFSDVMGQTHPRTTQHIPTSAAATGNQSNSNFKHAHRCLLCNNLVRHNFEPNLGKETARYLCPKCMKNAANETNCVFKCSKCGQMFPSWKRLNMHLPWHKERTGEEGVFKKPNLSCKSKPPGEPSPSTRNSSVAESVSVPSEQAKGIDSNTSSLSDLLKEPINPVKNQTNDAGLTQDVRIQLRKKLIDNPVKIHYPVTPRMPIPNQPVGSQLVINAPLSATRNVSGITVINRGNSTSLIAHKNVGGAAITSQVCTAPMNTSKDARVTAIISQDNTALPINGVAISNRNHTTPVNANFSTVTAPPIPIAPKNVDNEDKTLFSQFKEAITKQVNEAKSEDKPPKPQKQVSDLGVHKYKDMCVKITKDGARKTIQVLPDIPKEEPETIKVVPVSTGTCLSSQSMPVGTIASVTSPLMATNVTVPLAFGGNPLPKANLDGSCPTLRSLISAASRPGPIMLQPSRVDAVSTKPLTVSSVNANRNTTTNVTIKTVNSSQSGPLLVSLPVDPSQPVDSQTPRGVFLCYNCNLLFMDIQSLKNHGCEIEAFTCHPCNLTFKTPEQLYNHKCMSKPFTCHMCKKTCSSAKELNQHPCIDDSDIRIELDSKDSRTANAASKGKTSSSEGKGKFPSGVTDKGTDQDMEKGFRTMSWRDVSKGSNFICPDCGVEFNSKASLYIHKMKHNMRV
ncbi:uncharacterized protein LOC121408178 [Lytechinus variegatus]|uniref:uncharacterized protein LOC121408178 n=1 Tax=Lytechinus variegatus TaxID=7654 RepID=UPI001BB2CFCA|nr:uncharacterized protein LOC121408178 [Lytechinus variegatus]XP_041455471.1 uncharacterized protein LOC121408178 [Lytechinus variegatus]XP_041455472.1 uncharacterized protein LOC121408178 [Lytechinus variegatus]